MMSWRLRHDANLRAQMGPASAIKYLAKSIELMDDADRIVMMKGWEKSRGCRIEHEVAVAYGREVVYQ